MKRKPSLAAAAAPSPRASNGSSRGAFVEFHSSMSLENPATAFDLNLSHQPPKNSQERLTKSPEGDHHHATLESVLSQRSELWTQVNEVDREISFAVCLVL